ncbi:Flavanone 3-dioxygenase [Bertholletia excelsa]
MMLEEKQAFSGRNIWDPIRFGTGVDVKVEKFFFWRDFLKLFVHPEFHCPSKPEALREAVREYSIKTRAIVLELLKCLSEAMGLGPSYIEKTMNMDSSFQIFASNLYPPCPQPELAMGIPAHTDHGLLTMLIENGIAGLEIQHNGGWYNVYPLPNSFVVNIADQLEVLSNGRYKSIWHRAAVNNKITRMSIACPHGPSLDTVVAPAPELLDGESRPALYNTMKYKDYMDMLGEGKPCLERVRRPVA